MYNHGEDGQKDKLDENTSVSGTFQGKIPANMPKKVTSVRPEADEANRKNWGRE